MLSKNVFFPFYPSDIEFFQRYEKVKKEIRSKFGKPNHRVYPLLDDDTSPNSDDRWGIYFVGEM